MNDSSSSKFNSFPNSSNDALNETAASSRRLSHFDVGNPYNVPFQHRNIDLTADHAAMEARQNPPMIVHPNSHNAAFGKDSLFGNKRRISTAETMAGSGVLAELQTRDKFFRVQLIENELYRNRHSCYKVWMLAQPVVAVGVIFGLCSGMAHPDENVPTWTLVISVLLTIWHTVHSVVEFLAIKQKSFIKAEKALKSFCLFIMVLFICTMAMSVTVFDNAMKDVAKGLQITVAVVVTFAVAIVYYLLNLSGAVKVYQILKKKAELQQNIEEESRAVSSILY